VAGKVSIKLKYKRRAETLKQAIGAVVTQLRLERGWSQKHVAIKAGYSESWANQLENGKINPSLELLIAFADMFKMSLTQFFARAERKHLKSKPAAASSKLRRKS
jgi:transcriptional regulator with XRE-family HTH domain